MEKENISVKTIKYILGLYLIISAVTL